MITLDFYKIALGLLLADLMLITLDFYKIALDMFVADPPDKHVSRTCLLYLCVVVFTSEEIYEHHFI